MQTGKDAAASVKAGMDKTKATIQEKAEKMTTHHPIEKEMATEKKEERISEAEMKKREAKARHAVENPHVGVDPRTGYGSGGGVFP